MPIQITCPACKSKYTISDDLRGKKIRCRQCDKPLLVPAAPSSKPKAAGPRQEREEEGVSARRPTPPSTRPRSKDDDKDLKRPSRRMDDDEDRPRRRDDEDLRKPVRRRDDEDDEDRPRRRDDEDLKKPVRRRDDDDEEDEDRPRRKADEDLRRPVRRQANDDDEDDEDDEEDRPRRREKSSKHGGQMLLLLLVGGGAGVLALMLLVVALVVFLRPSSDNPPTGPSGPVVEKVDTPVANPPGEMDVAVVQKVKQSTAYLRVPTVRGVAQGSGFFCVEPGMVVTNAHVLGMLRADSRPPDNVDVVVNNGEPNEIKMSGTVLGVDRESDLAILRVQGDPTRMPAPLPLGAAKTLTETQKVYIFGFPLGSSLGKNITVSPTAVSSLRRNSSGVLTQVQVNGGMHPGNSGGPVTDTRGVVVGVSVAGISGTQINFAVPAEAVRGVFDGRILEREVGVPYLEGGQRKVQVKLVCLDPLSHIRDLKMEVWTAPPGTERPASDQPPGSLPSDGPHQNIPLAYINGVGQAEITLPAYEVGKTFWLRPILTSSSGATQWGTAVAEQCPVAEGLERKPATLQFLAPASQVLRTVKLLNAAHIEMFKPGGGVDKVSTKLETNMLESIQPDPGAGTHVTLTLGSFDVSSEEDGQITRPPAQVLERLRIHRPPPEYWLSNEHKIVHYRRPNFNNVGVPPSFREDLVGALCSAGKRLRDDHSAFPQSPGHAAGKMAGNHSHLPPDQKKH